MLYREKSSFRSRKKLILLCIVLLLSALVIWGVFKTAHSIKNDISAQTLESIKSTVLRSAVQCYAVEGCYPQNLEYLEKNYGLQLNHEQYFIDYQVFASNIMPDVAVLQR